MRFLKIALSVVIGAGVLALSGVAGYFGISYVYRQKKQAEDWDGQSINSVSNDVWKRFYQSNSLKLSMQSEDIVNESILVSQGTAWSWYYTWDAQTRIFDWYLMTNFHVINEAAYWNFNKNQNYINQQEIPINQNSFFELSSYQFNSYVKYKPFINNSFVSASLIYDVKTSNANKNKILFSDFGKYTLDMALVKLSFSYNFTQTFINYNIINPVQEYMRMYSSLSKTELTDITHFKARELTTIIGGNPQKLDRLVINRIEPSVLMYWVKKYQALQYHASGAEGNLSYLKAPYMQTSLYFNDWNLTEGSSGSPVFQTEQDLNTMSWNDVCNLIPRGIYWGGFGNTSSNFYPSIIPFIHSSTDVRYNVYLNFIQNYLDINLDN